MSKTPEQLLDEHGICKTCGTLFVHELDGPFASCKCGTSEWYEFTPFMKLQAAHVTACEVRDALQREIAELRPFHTAALAPRNLDQIVGAIRMGEPFTLDEARRAVVAFDVFLNRIQIDKYTLMMKEYFILAEQCPKAYAGEENSPDNPEFVEWYRAMRSVKVK